MNIAQILVALAVAAGFGSALPVLFGPPALHAQAEAPEVERPRAAAKKGDANAQSRLGVM
jgi:hypothetical protein